jgi:protein-S-isoprenylcysteine O-methyltransferase Ste14
LLVISEAMIVVLMVFRRRASTVDRSMLAALVTFVSVAGPPLLRPVDTGALLPDLATAFLTTVGLALVIAAKFTLGRSFGIVPANRGVVASGPYLLMRHPIYTGYLVTHVSFLLAHPTPRNMVLILLADSALVWRALMEERVLEHDERYRDYRSRVGWRLVPGVF